MTLREASQDAKRLSCLTGSTWIVVQYGTDAQKGEYRVWHERTVNDYPPPEPYTLASRFDYPIHRNCDAVVGAPPICEDCNGRGFNRPPGEYFPCRSCRGTGYYRGEEAAE